MFWKKSAKPSDLTISGKFHLGGPHVSTESTSAVDPGASKAGTVPFIPSNSDGTLRESGRDISHGSSQNGASQFPLSSVTPVRARESVARRDGGARYVVPKGYKVSSSTFVQGLVRVDGELGGRAVAATAVEISAGGVVSAPLEANSLYVAGQLTASAEVRGCIEVLSSAEVSGPMVSAELVVEPGARVASSRLQVG
jgi:cytoskeletal protein CcmA (bactofilin family)